MATQRITLQATPRTMLGREVRVLRREGKVPANVYGKNQPSTAVTLNQKEFSKLYSNAGETTLIDLSIEGEKAGRPVLIREVSRHPVTNAIVHVDFQQVSLKEKVTAMIPVESMGESEAVKGGAVLVVVHSELEVEALPTDLPEQFEIDLSKLNAIGDDIKVSDLVFDRSKVTLTLEDDEVLATLQAQAEEVVEEVTAEPAEVELVKQGATKEVPEGEEGAAPAAKADEK